MIYPLWIYVVTGTLIWGSLVWSLYDLQKREQISPALQQWMLAGVVLVVFGAACILGMLYSLNTVGQVDLALFFMGTIVLHMSAVVLAQIYNEIL